MATFSSGAGQKQAGTDPLVTTDGSGGHRPEVIALAAGGANARQGAASVSSSQVAAAVTAATLAVARATRRSLTIKNLDTSITVYVGPATVTAANGMELKAGQSFAVTWVGLVQVIAASGTPTVAIWDEYDS